MKKVIVKDNMQSDYIYYLIKPIGRSFDCDFKPELKPKEMLELGIFGGKYMTDCQDEYPKSWFEKAKLSPFKSDPKLNYYGIAASLPLVEWQKKGWIFEEDPRGWFQWYCRYYMGRRIPEEDFRQIKRWKAIIRHRGAIRKNCERYNLGCRRKQRQVLLHWAYDSREI